MSNPLGNGRSPRWRWIGGTAVLLVAVAIGFAGGGREFAEVEGRVTLDGKPLGDAEVVFLPDPFKGNRGNNASGFTDAEGRYRIRAERDDRDGTVLGAHRVVIVDLQMVVDTTGAGMPRGVGDTNRMPQQPGTKPRRFPTSYGDALRTPFDSIEIKSGSQILDFDVKSKSGKEEK